MCKVILQVLFVYLMFFHLSIANILCELVPVQIAYFLNATYLSINDHTFCRGLFAYIEEWCSFCKVILQCCFANCRDIYIYNLIYIYIYIYLSIRYMFLSIFIENILICLIHLTSRWLVSIRQPSHCAAFNCLLVSSWMVPPCSHSFWEE